MMEAAMTSETLVNFYQTTRRYNLEDSHLRNHRRENFKPNFTFTYQFQPAIKVILARVICLPFRFFSDFNDRLEPLTD
jgi:hypothetical protein